MTNWDSAKQWLDSVNSLIPRVADVGYVPPALESGQVWRARWDDVVSMVYIDQTIGTFRNLVRVAPVTVGEDMADDLTVVLPSNSTSLSAVLSIWTELVTDIAEVVLERWITTVDAFSTLEELVSAADAGELEWGIPILNEVGRRAVERRELVGRMKSLGSAAHVVSGDGSMPALISSAGISVAILAQAIGVKLTEAFEIKRGSSIVVGDDAKKLANLLQVDFRNVLAANPTLEDGFISAVTSLSVRPRLLQLELVDGTNDSVAFGELTRGSLALAARQEGESRAWRARVDLFFEARLGERL